MRKTFVCFFSVQDFRASGACTILLTAGVPKATSIASCNEAKSARLGSRSGSLKRFDPPLQSDERHDLATVGYVSRFCRPLSVSTPAREPSKA